MFSFGKDDILRAAEIVAMLIIALVMIFFVARPLIKGVFEPQTPGGNLALAGAGGGSISGGDDRMALPGEGDVGDARMELARIEGSVNANAMREVGDMVSSNPDQTVSVIRGWLQEGKK